MKLRPALALALVLFAAAPSLGQDSGLPAGVVARVHGEDVTEAQLLDRLARRYETQERGKQILEQIVDDQIVALEAQRRGVTVTDEEARAYVDRTMAEVVRMRGKDVTLDDLLRETRTTREEFHRSAKEYLTREKMAREDLGTKPGEELTEHRMKLWLSSLRRKMEVRYEGLGEGVLAQVGESVRIDRARFARELRTRLPDEMIAGVRMELVLDAGIRHAVQRAGVVVAEADVDAQIVRLRERFEKNPRVQGTGVTFDQFLRQTFGIGEADLRRDPSFRARVGLEQLLGRDVTEERAKKHWEENRLAYGERALVRQVYVPAADDAKAFGGKLLTFREAQDVALRAKVQILEKSGALKGGGDAAAPLPDVVTQVAKANEQDPEKRQRAGEPIAWTRQNVAADKALEQAVFEGEIGKLVGPVRSSIGYHVLVVEERRPAPGWDEVKTQVREDLLRVAVHRFQVELRNDPAVVIAK